MKPSSPETFERVFSAELEEIAKRQGKTSGNEVDRKELAGLALSGGGIRSATTSLGALQALKKLGLLNVFDYLSTVSGGGFTGSWWSAWTSRNFKNNHDQPSQGDSNFFPPPELTQPERDAVMEERKQMPLDPVHHLRLFSNYLTPVKGLLSSDIWRANTVISRNLLLTWLVLLPMLFAAVLLAQSYFTIQPDAETEFLYPYSHQAEDDAIVAQLEFGLNVTKRLDSMVHGLNSVSELAPIRKLREYNEPVAMRNIGEKRDPLLVLIREIDSLQHSDSAAVQDLGNLRALPGLRTELGSVEQGMRQWHSADSALETPRVMADKKGFDSAIHTTNVAYARILDPDVDSIRSNLARLEEEMLDHRASMRESWLFNSTHLDYLAKRVLWASYLPVMMLGWIAMLICLWMVTTGDKLFGGNIVQGSYAFMVGLLVFNIANWLVPNILGIPDVYDQSFYWQVWLNVGWGLIALVFLNRILWDDAHWFWKAHRKTMNEEDRVELLKLLDVRRSKIVGYHQRLLLGVSVTIVLLAFGGFGHEVINYLLFYHSSQSLDVWQDLARVASVLAIASALAGSGLAARSATPASDRGTAKKSKTKELLMKLAPPLILIVLMCGIAWASHWVLQDLSFRQGESKQHHYILIVFSMWMLGFLSLYYAVYDLHFRSGKRSATAGAGLVTRKDVNRILLFGIILVQMGIMIAAIIYPSVRYSFSWMWLLLPAAVWTVTAWKYRTETQGTKQNVRVSAAGANNQRMGSSGGEAGIPHTASWRKLLSGGTSTGLVLAFSSLLLILIASILDVARLPIDHLFLVALGASMLLFLIDLAWGIRAPEEGRRGNHEARVLLGINITLCSLFLIIPSTTSHYWGLTHILEILIAVSIGLVIFVGWRVDPNALSIHAFYKQRIIRAYLGASNALRHRASVSEVHPADDIQLSKLTNCEHGAPYHLINTTLNLLGTKSLESAQRHASNFIFSKRYCGSVTTGYRPTDEYMSGTMTLGTAVAISGAAASPNMGSNQVSGATTMLMSLLNVRLGYWAANPGQMRWKESQPKLWPYYLLRESLSQTSGFGAFCYLTDGGHFDNTGLYPLIERACRYIVLCDNGADPEAHFKDIGNALRRARIDFGVEFDLSGLKDMTSMNRRRAGSHWLRGTVRYCEEHVRLVWGEAWDDGLSADEREQYLTGTILILKPTLVGDEPADVLQYGLANADFPQQSTANQWFSEDQFESYRRLGYWSVQTAFGKPDYSTGSRSEQLEAIAEWPAEMVTETVAPMTDLAYGATLEPAQAD